MVWCGGVGSAVFEWTVVGCGLVGSGAVCWTVGAWGVVVPVVVWLVLVGSGVVWWSVVCLGVVCQLVLPLPGWPSSAAVCLRQLWSASICPVTLHFI